MRSTPDNDSPSIERRKGTRRRAANPAVTARVGERRQNDRRDATASSGMRIKSASPSSPSLQSPNLIAQSMIDALTDILEYENNQSRAKRAS
jgi:hypothetical protein